MWKQWVDKLVDAPVDESLSKFETLQYRVLESADRFRDLSDDALKSRVIGGDRDTVFSVLIEVAERTLGLRPYPVQILAALAMSERNLVEMETGEGKTLTATLPATLFALEGRGCHVLTFNDYLAARDAAWMNPVYAFFGLSVGVIQKSSSWEARQHAYRCDVTYATAEEAGFDYLRNELCTSDEARLQRELAYVIVDEADSILIDEARTPLVIAGPMPTSSIGRAGVDSLVATLDGECVAVDSNARNVALTDVGIFTVERLLDCGALHNAANRPILTLVNQALHAHHLLTRNVDYIVRDDQVHLVDEFTGRVAANKRWPDGLQAAIEAKEGVAVRDDGRVLGSITCQHFIRLYPQVCGMTATAWEDAEEFHRVYGTKVVPIPPHRPCRRLDYPDVVFTDKHAKADALVEEVSREHRAGRPVLVGTATVEESASLAARIRNAGLECSVLNAANDKLEAEIIANAGLPGAITISTNMAGRDTDIKLGGVAEAHRQTVLRAGGLHVIGTNRFESSRIDRQLRGRAGRQGDPGTSRFIISFEDDLLVRFRLPDYLPNAVDMTTSLTTPVSDPRITLGIARLQRVVASDNGQARATLWKYSQMQEEQRQAVSRWRDTVIAGGESHLDACRNANALRSKYRGAIARIERHLLLHHIDDCWAEHLAVVADMRESANLTIRLTDIGGLDPYLSYRQRIHAAFLRFHETVLDRLVEDLQAERFDHDQTVSGRPSNTWTYLINDQFFDQQRRAMHRYANSGETSLVVLLIWPFMLAWALWRKIRKIGFSG
ncbi:MAG: accessory Sec system translocase SecA2 [Gammaproteobacteria bacterium]|nr:accessory Sec system translocase SecA2 [Gammaproteobacteria bacterium]